MELPIKENIKYKYPNYKYLNCYIFLNNLKIKINK